MSSLNKKSLRRRTFLGLTGGWIAGSSIFGRATGEQKPLLIGSLPERLNDEEEKLVAASSMAEMIPDHFGNPYSCAEALWLAALKKMNRSEDLVWVAGGFGGGIMHKDLCGFLTAGVMALGFSAGNLDLDRKAAKKICSQNVKQYWKWWESMAPLKCSEIRTEGTNSKVCLRLGQLAAAKCEALMSDVKE